MCECDEIEDSIFFWKQIEILTNLPSIYVDKWYESVSFYPSMRIGRNFISFTTVYFFSFELNKAKVICNWSMTECSEYVVPSCFVLWQFLRM